MKKFIVPLFVISIIFVFLTNSCVNRSDNKQETTLTLGVMSSMDYLPLAVAQREGYFGKEGLNIKIQKFYSANERDAALQSENIDGCVIDFTGAVLQKAGGIDLLLTSKCDAPFYIVAGANTNINTLADLKGKNIAVSQNTVIDFIVDMALKSAGLSKDDIQKSEVNKIPVRFELLRNNKIDATGLPNPFALMAQSEGDKILTSNDDLGFAITGIVFHKKALDSKDELVRKMYQAYNMGVDYIKNNPIDSISGILVKEFAFPETIAKNVQIPDYTHAVMPSENDIQTATAWLQDKKLVKPEFDYKTLLDSSYIGN